MSNVSALMDIFKMQEIAPKTRANLIIVLGRTINMEFGMNLTEPLVYELVLILDPQNTILNHPMYKPTQEPANEQFK